MSELPVIEAPTGGNTPREESQSARVHGVLLAAGTSSRFGEENKLLATVEGKPIVRHAAETLLGADLAVTVVLGHERERVREALGDLDVTFVEAENYAAGQSRSLRRGIEAVQDRRPAVDAVLIALGDMPDVSSATVARLRAAYETARRSALATAYEGQRGNPVLFDAEHFDALTATDGDTGGRAVLLNAEDAALIETGDPGVVRDVDLPGDLTEGR